MHSLKQNLSYCLEILVPALNYVMFLIIRVLKTFAKFSVVGNQTLCGELACQPILYPNHYSRLFVLPNAC